MALTFSEQWSQKSNQIQRREANMIWGWRNFIIKGRLTQGPFLSLAVAPGAEASLGTHRLLEPLIHLCKMLAKN